jgi:hypothetical protein
MDYEVAVNGWWHADSYRRNLLCCSLLDPIPEYRTRASELPGCDHSEIHGFSSLDLDPYLIEFDPRKFPFLASLNDHEFPQTVLDTTWLNCHYLLRRKAKNPLLEPSIERPLRHPMHLFQNHSLTLLNRIVSLGLARPRLIPCQTIGRTAIMEIETFQVPLEHQRRQLICPKVLLYPQLPQVRQPGLTPKLQIQ